MIIDIHTHMDDVVGGGIVLYGEEREKYQKYIADLHDMRKYLAELEKISFHITGDQRVFACVLDVEPNTKYENILNYSVEDSRILPFISPDFTLPKETMVERIKKYGDSSYGMKIHPIIQGIRVNEEIVFSAIEAYLEFEKPVILHTGRADYGNYFKPCPYDRDKSDIESTRDLLKKYPGLNIVLGHAGMFEHEEWAKELSGYNNAYIDSSFKYAKEYTLLKKYYGADRILFGSDFPFYEPSDIDDIKEAFTTEEQIMLFETTPKRLLKLK